MTQKFLQFRNLPTAHPDTGEVLLRSELLARAASALGLMGDDGEFIKAAVFDAALWAVLEYPDLVDELAECHECLRQAVVI